MKIARSSLVYLECAAAIAVPTNHVREVPEVVDEVFEDMGYAHPGNQSPFMVETSTRWASREGAVLTKSVAI